jgi:RNA polymerase sigma-70 factor (ECF subfamily)
LTSARPDRLSLLSGRANNRPNQGQQPSVCDRELQDDVLLIRSATGDGNALGELFRRYSRLVRTIAGRILGDAAEGEDLAQDLFLFIQRKSAIFDSSKSSARSWIVQMTYHRAIERRRYLTARRFYASRGDGPEFGQPVGIPTTECDYSSDAVFGRNGLEKVMNNLSSDQKETLRLHFFEGHTFAEISTKMGQSLGNVRHHYYRALEKIREQMFEDGAHGK